MPISAAEFQRRLQPLLNKRLLENKVSELTLELGSQDLLKDKRNELSFGYMPNGKKIGRYANPDYAERKNLLSGLPGRGYVDLKLTGSFHASLFLNRTSTGLIFESTNDGSKVQGLVNKYSKDIFGISKKSIVKLQVEKIQPELRRFIKRQLGQA